MAPALAAYGGDCGQRISVSIADKRNKTAFRACRDGGFLEGGGVFTWQNFIGLCGRNNCRHAFRSVNRILKAPL